MTTQQTLEVLLLDTRFHDGRHWPGCDCAPCLAEVSKLANRPVYGALSRGYLAWLAKQEHGHETHSTLAVE